MTAASDLEFLDSNIWVYAHDASAVGKQSQAQELIGRLRSDRRMATSVQVLQEFFVTSTRKVTPPLPIRDAAAAVADIATGRVHRPGAADVAASIDIHQRAGLSFWDSMIVRSAAQLGCVVLWTEDLSDGEVFEGVQVRNPFA